MNESNIGQTIKSVVSILCVIGIIACVIAGIALISQGLGAIGWPVMLVGAFSMAITYLFLYGFGELVDKTCANNAALLRIEKELEALKQKNGEESQPAAAPEKGSAKAQSAAAPAGSSTSKPERPAPQQPRIEAPVAPGELISKEMMSAMQGMKSATEIYDYLSQKLDASDKDTEDFLKILARIVTNERLYGNDAYGAMAKVRAFAEHGCRVFAVDRSAPTMICPACGNEQNANRTVCISCGALFAPEKDPAKAQPAAAPAGSSASKPERPAPQQPRIEVPVAPRELISKEMMSAMQGMKSATEIYDYLSQKLDKSDKDTEEFLKILARIVTNERLYGEDAYGAMAKVQAFAKHGCRVFAVDRSAPTLICPACGNEQNANRTVCISCGALFRQ